MQDSPRSPILYHLAEASPDSAERLPKSPGGIALGLSEGGSCTCPHRQSCRWPERNVNWPLSGMTHMMRLMIKHLWDYLAIIPMNRRSASANGKIEATEAKEP